MSRIASSVQGRLRLCDERLRDAAWGTRLQRAAEALPGVIRVRVNAAACSIVVEYAPNEVSRAAFERSLLACIPVAQPGIVAVPERAVPARRVWRQRANRYAKYGAMASLAFSLLAAASGRKRLHIASGGVFLAFLGVHMYIHRRHLGR